MSSEEPSLVTHKNFKSIVPGVHDAETMNKYLGYALGDCDMFDKRTSPWEKSMMWREEELEKFQIDLEKVDRLYHIRYDEKDGWTKV